MTKIRKQSIRWTAMAASLLLGFVISSTGAFALEPNQAIYIGGSVAVAPDTTGTLDTTPPRAIVFRYKKPDGTAGQIGIEYAAIKTANPTNEVTHHLGVAPAIAVGLFAPRQRRYFITVTWVDEAGIAQAAQLELSKRDQQMGMAVIRARMPQQCQRTSAPCTRPVPRASATE